MNSNKCKLRAWADQVFPDEYDPCNHADSSILQQMRVLQSLRSTPRRTSARVNHTTRYVTHPYLQKRCCSSHGNSEPIIKPSSCNPPNDHHTLGKRLNLFSTTPYSAGSPLLHADGSYIFLKLQSLLRAQHQAFGFREVITPTIYKQSLWEKSGHWQNYSDDMFEITGRGARRDGGDKESGKDVKWGLKPMNCPGHCLLFATEGRSFRDLPVRFADFSPLHRNEISGALSGLTRVRRFHQDDGHIFCRPDQVKTEIASTLQMINLVYSAFSLKPHKLLLSTRPEESFIGTESEWTEAESQLQAALEESGLDWSLNPRNGAFYGPKIDIILRDNQGKEHQTATIQLDFQLPRRFNLQYQNSAAIDHQVSTQTPILIHRAILGSIERFMALLIEHYNGKWPLWLNPRQVCILTLNNTQPVLSHATKIASILTGASSHDAEHKLQPLLQPQYTVDTDSTNETLARKIVHARAKGYGILCFVGKQEAERGDVAVTFLCPSATVGGGGDSTRLERVIQNVLPHATTENSEWRKKRKVVCSAEELRRIMGGLCEEWL